MQCKNPFRFCLWSSWSQAKKCRSTSLGFNSYRTQSFCFWTIPMAWRCFEMTCWVTPNDSVNSCCVWHESSESNISNLESSKIFSFSLSCRSSTLKSAFLKPWNHSQHVLSLIWCCCYVDICPPSLLCDTFDLPILTSTYRCNHLSKNVESKVVHLIQWFFSIWNQNNPVCFVLICDADYGSIKKSTSWCKVLIKNIVIMWKNMFFATFKWSKERIKSSRTFYMD